MVCSLPDPDNPVEVYLQWSKFMGVKVEYKAVD